MNTVVLCKVERTAYSGLPALISPFVFPYRRGNEFDYVFAMGRDEYFCALVTLEQKYALLGRLVDELWSTFTELAFVLIETRMPSGCRLPPSLMSDSVFMCVSAAREVQRLLAEEMIFVLVREGLVCHCMELGENEVAVEWYGPYSQNRGERLADCINRAGIFGAVTIDVIGSENADVRR